MVGDVIPVIAAWLSRRPVAAYLVAYSSHYEGKLRLPWPCAALLRSPNFQTVFSRDQLTADDLSCQLKRPVQFLGNPFMDPVLTPAPPLPAASQRIGLLPGSRRPELDANLELMLQLVTRLPLQSDLSLDLALVPSLGEDDLAMLAKRAGWMLQGDVLVREGAQEVHVHRGAFQGVLQSSDLVIGMAGTAVEQAVGLCKPALQLPGGGPQFTSAFAEAQRRLLGPTVFCATGAACSTANLDASAELCMDLLSRSQTDEELQRRCCKEAQRRLGNRGGGLRMAEAISSLLP